MSRFVTGFGGKGANQCVASSKLGAITAIVGKLGHDDYGKSYMQNFQECGVLTGKS